MAHSIANYAEATEPQLAQSRVFGMFPSRRGNGGQIIENPRFSGSRRQCRAATASEQQTIGATDPFIFPNMKDTPTDRPVNC
jgi:hypothetical protein